MNQEPIFCHLFGIFVQNLKIFSLSTVSLLSSPIEYLKGVGPLRADMLKKELSLFTFNDLLHHFPYRHIDKTKVNTIASITPDIDFVQIKGVLQGIDILGVKRSKRMVTQLKDETGSIELAWFQGISWVQKNILEGQVYLVFGRVSFFNGKAQMVHPEIEPYVASTMSQKSLLEPVYSTTEKLKARGLNAKQIGKLTQNLFQQISQKDVPENLPTNLLDNRMSRWEAYRQIHFPISQLHYKKAVDRLIFEELFMAQVRLNLIKIDRHKNSKGHLFEKVGTYFNTFYTKHLPFELTGAQKRVIKEIRQDVGKGYQMNRLLQGDVGSGKTMIALMAMLIAADNGFQSCLMAPTEILASQHYESLTELLKEMPIEIALLTGSTKIGERRRILKGLLEDDIHFVVGTHAIIEDVVQFKNLGLAVIDEQHRFGVAQRAKLWKKSSIPPHVLVMTATPIPRTLAMTAFGDLDYSVMDELPPGRQVIKTVHRYETSRASVMDFVKTEIKKGRQAYYVYPLIEESEKLSFEDLMQGYEQVKSFFPEPTYKISMVHGRQNSLEKETNMHRFKTGDTQILVGTTVIEVGVNVPNASVMVIESAEKFGLSQLHQLRGRVGRGKEQSYCILLSSVKAGKEAKERLKIMCTTNDGFLIAEKDLELRGPGDIDGTRQSGALNFKLANIINDKTALEEARLAAYTLCEKDPTLQLHENSMVRSFLISQKSKIGWGKIA
ncbi:MAG: ATP-dependent DNA helicase RecG [Chitinophagia bacterium]|nr:ATP-dependent DNA helicase RecG [Chitinophagia bacterium]